MKIKVKAKPRARENKVEKINEEEYIVSITAAPERGKANKAIEKLLADYFKVSLNKVVIVSGQTAREKIVLISF